MGPPLNNEQNKFIQIMRRSKERTPVKLSLGWLLNRYFGISFLGLASAEGIALHMSQRVQPAPFWAWFLLIVSCVLFLFYLILFFLKESYRELSQSAKAFWDLFEKQAVHENEKIQSLLGLSRETLVWGQAGLKRDHLRLKSRLLLLSGKFDYGLVPFLLASAYGIAQFAQGNWGPIWPFFLAAVAAWTLALAVTHLFISQRESDLDLVQLVLDRQTDKGV